MCHDKCRIACVRYLNTVPLIEGLEKVQGGELILTVAVADCGDGAER
jgi:hypothetical protein